MFQRTADGDRVPSWRCRTEHPSRILTLREAVLKYNQDATSSRCNAMKTQKTTWKTTTTRTVHYIRPVVRHPTIMTAYRLRECLTQLCCESGVEDQKLNKTIKSCLFFFLFSFMFFFLKLFLRRATVTVREKNASNPAPCSHFFGQEWTPLLDLDKNIHV